MVFRMIRTSNILNIITALTTLALILYWIGRFNGTDCFAWFDYFISFGTLFINLGINILAAFGK